MVRYVLLFIIFTTSSSLAKSSNFFCSKEFTSAKNYSLEVLKTKIEDSNNLNEQCTSGGLPAHHICGKGSPEIIDQFIKSGMNYKFKTYFGEKGHSCLTVALEELNTLESIQYIYSLDVPKNLPKCSSKFKFKYLPCHSFIRIYINAIDKHLDDTNKYDKNILKFFINKGENINAYYQSYYSSDEEITPLNYIVGNFYTDYNLDRQNFRKRIINDLIQLGANVNAPIKYKTYSGRVIDQDIPIKQILRVPSHHRSERNDHVLNLLDLLIKSGANVNYVSTDIAFGFMLSTVLGYKEKKFRHQIIKKFVVNGLNLNLQDRLGETILFENHYLINDPSTIDYLISLGANYKIRDNEANNLLHEANYENSPELVQKYLSLGLNPNSRNKYGHTPLFRNLIDSQIKGYKTFPKNNPEVKKHIKILKMMLKAGANIDAKDTRRNTLFHVAAQGEQDVEVLEILINKGLNINAKNYLKTTPLMLASRANCDRAVTSSKTNRKICINRKMKIIKYLVQNGADIKARDSDGRNVLHYAAISNDFSDLILYYIKKGVDHRNRDLKGKTPFDKIKGNYKLENTDAYWKLHDLSFE